MTLSKLIESEVADVFAGFGGPGEPDIQSGEAQQLLTARLLSLLERRERDKQEPVAYIFKHPAGKLFWALSDESNKHHDDVMPVYAAPPAPVVPDDFMDAEFRKFVLSKNYAVEDGGVLWGNLGFGAAVEAWQACRDAMLKQQSSIQACNSACSGAEIKQPASNGQSFGNSEQLNSPAVPDGWIKCSEQMPGKGDLDIWLFDGENVQHGYVWDGHSFVDWIEEYSELQGVTHWMPMTMPAAPKQESL